MILEIERSEYLNILNNFYTPLLSIPMSQIKDKPKYLTVGLLNRVYSLLKICSTTVMVDKFLTWFTLLTCSDISDSQVEIEKVLKF